MKEIGIGVIGTGFMGKAHSIAYSASASVFGTGLRPRLEIVCDLSPERASQRASLVAQQESAAEGERRRHLVAALAPFRHFDVAHCECYNEADLHMLRHSINTAFGSHEAFNRKVRRIGARLLQMHGADGW